jgi:hypothetical protein
MKEDFKVILGILSLSIVVFGGGIWFYSVRSADDRAKLAKVSMGEKIPNQESPHVAQGAEHDPYNSDPPTSGPMWGSVAGPGIKSAQVPDELVIHSLEHGAAVVWYKSDLPQADVARVTEAFNAASGKKIMSPRANLDVPVALTSWNYLLKLDSIDEVVITEFIDTNSDRAPEKGQI